MVENVVMANLSMDIDAGHGLAKRHARMLERTAWQADEMARGDGPGLIKNVHVSSPDDRSVNVTAEMKPIAERGYDLNLFVRNWRELAGMPESANKMKISASLEMLDNFKLELYHPEAEVLKKAGNILLKQLQTTSGVLDIDQNLDRSQEQWRVSVNDSGQALGLSDKIVSDQLFQMMDGDTIQRFPRNQDEVKVKLRYPDVQRSNLADLKQAMIRTPNGQAVPLVAVAELQSERNEEEITRINSQRAVYLAASLDKSALSPAQLQEQITATLKELQPQYPGLRAHFAGEAEEQQEVMGSLVLLATTAMIAIYTLLAIPLKSYVQPLLIMAAIPFGLVGALLGHWFNGLEFSVMSMFGLLALAGVIINNSLLMVTAYNDFTAQGKPFALAVEQACRSRLRPVLLTSATTFVGLVPLMSETSEQAKMLIPAATSLGYGILFGTAITLILVPVLLKIDHDIRRVLIQGKQELTGVEGDTSITG